MAVAGERAGGTLEVAGAEIEQDEPVVGEVAASELALDAVLALEQPVHGAVEVVGGGVADVEVVGEGGGMPPARGGELGMGLDDAGGDHSADEVALRGGLGGEQAGEAEAAEGLQHGLDGAMVPRADDGKDVGCLDEGAAGEMGLEQVDGRIGEVGEVGEGLFLDPAVVVAVGGAEQLGVVDLAVLDGLDDGDVHGGPI